MAAQASRSSPPCAVETGRYEPRARPSTTRWDSRLDHGTHDRKRHIQPPAAGRPRLRDGQVQLPLPVLHAGGDIRRALQVPAPRGAADVRGDRAARGHLRRPRSGEGPADGGRAARAQEHRVPRRAACRGGRHRRPDHDHQRLPAPVDGADAEGRRAPAGDHQPRQPRRRGLPQDERAQLRRGHGAQGPRGGGERRT